MKLSDIESVLQLQAELAAKQQFIDMLESAETERTLYEKRSRF